ncbi:MAG: Rieske 2Fe-2S domain-containing protein [Pyrobaculum sp.]
MAEIEVAAFEELKEGRPLTKYVDLGDRLLPVLLIKLGGEVYALEPLCPHAKWPLEVFGVFTERGGAKVVCKIHWGVWDLSDGGGRFKDREAPRLRTYKAVVRDGKVYVQL